MLKISIYCFFSLWSLSINASAQSVDSLKKLANKTIDKKSKIKLYNQIALKLIHDGKSREALTVYQKIINLAGSNRQLTASTYNEIGNVRADLGENKESFQAYQAA